MASQSVANTKHTTVYGWLGGRGGRRKVHWAALLKYRACKVKVSDLDFKILILIHMRDNSDNPPNNWHGQLDGHIV